MKHAYLILAHNDVSLLRTLVGCLDDVRNDIYIHWDAKSGENPRIQTVKSSLFFLEERVDVRWAGFSMVKAEYLLFKAAFKNGPYEYYHLLSGVDLPLKSQDYIHSECEKMAGTEFIGFADPPQSEIDFRVQHRFLFPEDFRTNSIFKKVIRSLGLKFQDITSKRRTDILIKKGAQWCSVTNDFVGFLLDQEPFVRKTFQNTFCPDELFIQTVCFNSPFMSRVKKRDSEYESNMRYIKWVNGELLPIEESDLPCLRSSDRWFARKFSSSSKGLIDKVVQFSR
jgi:hypothetical protein